jgi:cytochrome c oxidase assembly factor 2
MTSSLFATTVLASFFVVALPHFLPCPAPRRVYADGEMPDPNARRRRRRKPENDAITEDAIVEFRPGEGDENKTKNKSTSKRECPVPKPGGMLGEWLGFHKQNDDNTSSRADR